MEVKVKISTIYECTLERAFKTPMLCDVSKIHTGLGVMPKVTHTTDDDNWGQVGSSKKIFAAKSLTQKGGYASMDSVLERVENQYWKIQVDDFQFWVLGFYRFVGEWKTTELKANQIFVEYTYTLYAKNKLLYPAQMVFAKTFWKVYMKQVIENIRQLAYNKEPYLYD